MFFREVGEQPYTMLVKHRNGTTANWPTALGGNYQWVKKLAFKILAVQKIQQVLIYRGGQKIKSIDHFELQLLKDRQI